MNHIRTANRLSPVTAANPHPAALLKPTNNVDIVYIIGQPDIRDIDTTRQAQHLTQKEDPAWNRPN